jgi:hypothetical protein
LIAVAVASVASAGDAAARPVHIRGTAYEFNNTRVLLDGATVRIAEYPRLRARTRADGTYDVAVPDRANVTPYIRAAGHHTIFLQTFRTNGENLDRVNFQTPTEDVYRALAALLAVPLQPNGELRDCAIVSTFSTRNVRALPFQEFTAYGAHGVAGASAFATPALPVPTYFNEDVVPDPAQRRSSSDGGVIWTEVSAGRYTIRARHPATRFASFLADCKPGRVINANPPWGLHELGIAMPASVSARWLVRPGGIELRGLRLSDLPANATVRVGCSGAGCPFSHRTLKQKKGGRLDVVDALGSSARRIRAGQTLSLLLSAPAHDGKLVRWRLRAGRDPAAVTRCVPLGSTKPRRRC